MLKTAVILTVIASSVCVGQTYSVAAIPAPTGITYVTWQGINNSGQVAGTGTDGAQGAYALIGSTSGSAVIPRPNAADNTTNSYTSGSAINSSGQVVGTTTVGFDNQTREFGFIGNPSGSSVIPMTVSYWTYLGVTGVNALGQVAGSYSDSNSSYAFIGTTAGITTIPVPSGWSSSQGLAVNNYGQVAGGGSTASQTGAPFIGTVTGSTAIPLPSGWTYGVAYAINDSGQVAGNGYTATQRLTFFGTASGTVAIPLPAGATTSSVTYGSLNSSGRVVGSSDVGGWIWDATNGLRLLNVLVPSGWNVTNAISISDNGLILAQASYMGGASEYVVLSPPCTYSINPSSIVVSDIAGSSAVTVTSAAQCNWGASSNVSWLVVTSGPSGSGNGTVDFNFFANNGPPRVGTLTVAGQPFFVNQGAPAPPAPTLTSPANGATGIPVTPLLTWNPSALAASYDVYLGTSATPSFVANVTSTSYTPAALAQNKTYYWQTVAKNADGANGSSISSFTTLTSQTYSVAAIPTPSGITFAVWTAINNSGQVSGYGNIPSSNAQLALIGTTSGSSTIPLPADGAVSAGGYAINNSGQVAGIDSASDFVEVQPHVFIGNANGSAVIPLIVSNVAGLNDSGQVLGNAGQPIIGTASGSTAIPYPTGWSIAQGYAMNNLGQVVGVVYSSTDLFTALSAPFIGTVAGSALIPLPSGYSTGGARGINDSGQVVGGAAGVNTPATAFIGTATGTVTIPLPIGATYSSAGWINNSGTVLGSSDAGSWIWDPTNGVRLLNGFLPSGWAVASVLSLSNSGLILAQATYNGGATQYVVLTPPSMTANPGTTPQSAPVDTAFSYGLAVTVRDSDSNPVAGINVAFTAPGSGASGVFSNLSTTIVVATNGSGVASAPFTANATAGGPYIVTAAATGLTTVSFSLTNTGTAPSAPVLTSPTNAASGVSVATSLNWNAASGATSYDIHFGTSSSPALVGNTMSTTFSPGALVGGTTYYWQIVAKNSTGSAASSIWSFTTQPQVCTYQTGSGTMTVSATAGNDSVTVTAQPGCAWSAISAANWVGITSGSGNGNGAVMFSISANTGGYRSTELSIAGQGFVVNQLAHRVASITDFDGDGKADLAIYRASTGLWSIQPSSTGGLSITAPWGLPGDISVVGDFDGDKVLDFAVYRPSTGTWYIIPSSTGVPYAVGWGLPGDVPIPADYDGDGKTDLAVWRPSNQTWYVIPSSNPSVPIVKTWGIAGDQPVQGDFDGDGKKDFAVFRPSTGAWYIIPSSTGVAYGVAWGIPGDTPVPGDFDGDGKTDLAVYRPSAGTWYVIPSSTGVSMSRNWGLLGDLPALIDYDGDHKADFSVYRPSNQTWYVIQSSSGTVAQQLYGIPNDIPLYRPWPWQ